MNILVVCRELPYPPDAGYKIRTFNLIKHLSKRNSISLVCYEGPDNQEDYVRNASPCVHLLCIFFVALHRSCGTRATEGGRLVSDWPRLTTLVYELHSPRCYQPWPIAIGEWIRVLRSAEMARKRAFRIGRSRTGLGLFATAPIK